MDMNQAFEKLKKAGGARAARIILNKLKNPNHIKIYFAARKLRQGMPVAKIINEKWFYGLPFWTDKNTLDPRPDSETLVDAVLNFVGAHICAPSVANATDNIIAPDGAMGRNYAPLHILDLGTGTGCLICAIVKNLPNATGVGIDKSLRAVRIARKNVKNLKLKNKIKIERGNFSSQLSSVFATLRRDRAFIRLRCATPRQGSQFDIIVANPPYIAIGDSRVNAGAKFDPKEALYAGPDGLTAYRAIAKNAKNLLKQGGQIFLEIGAGQSKAVKKIFTDCNWQFEKSYKDLSGIIRVLEFS